MSGVWVWIIAGIVVVALVVIVAVVIVAVVIANKRGSTGEEPVVDPPYGRRGVDNPTTDDPQPAPGVEPDGARFVEDPDAIRNPKIDGESPGQSTPGSFPPPGPPRE